MVTEVKSRNKEQSTESVSEWISIPRKVSLALVTFKLSLQAIRAINDLGFADKFLVTFANNVNSPVAEGTP